MERSFCHTVNFTDDFLTKRKATPLAEIFGQNPSRDNKTTENRILAKVFIATPYDAM